MFTQTPANIIKRHSTNPQNSLFLAKMEPILQRYTRPVLCCDERPCFLSGDQVEPLALQASALCKEQDV